MTTTTTSWWYACHDYRRFSMKERGEGGRKKSGKLVTLLSAGFLSARLNFCCSAFFCLASSDSAPFRRGGADHTSGATTANRSPPLCPSSTIARKKGWRAKGFQRGLLPRRMNFSPISSTTRSTRAEGCVSRWMARRWISRGVTTFDEEEWQMTFRYILSFSFFFLSDFSSR